MFSNTSDSVNTQNELDVSYSVFIYKYNIAKHFDEKKMLKKPIQKMTDLHD